MRLARYLGVDQTGAARRGGKSAAPLPVALAERRGERRLKVELGSIESATETKLREFIGEAAFDSSVGILLDCVIGLPSAFWGRVLGEEAIWKLMRSTRNCVGPRGELFGRAVAQKFFSTIWEGAAEQIPKRRCERLARSNSVFQVHPFQKNIQTGTFRIWRDLSQSNDEWARIWPFSIGSESLLRSAKPWLFEVYPSLIWRICFGLPTRNLALLEAAARSVLRARRYEVEFTDWRALKKNPDLADAFALALGGVLLDDDARLFEPFPGFRKIPELSKEGWIIGLAP